MEGGISGIGATAFQLEYTGERIVPGKTPEALFREHEERYVFAAQYVAERDVLDVACGTGVGSSFLQRAGARSVLGLDIDPKAIAFAKATYGDCEFAQSDAMALCLKDNSVDVVVSFETLEHLQEPEGFLMECRRVLRSGGTLVCSTPNLEISRWGSGNPFHVHEFSPRGFKGLVGSIFSSAEFFGQRNRMFLPRVGKLVILRALERLRLRGGVEWILRRRSAPGYPRTEFANDVSALRGAISPHRWDFLRQPTFLIAVAHTGQVREGISDLFTLRPRLRDVVEPDQAPSL